MKIVLILCKSSYRKSNLNNASKLTFLEKHVLVTLSGVFFYLGLFLNKFKIFKIISIDGDPLINKKKGINLWLSGTTEKIPKHVLYLNNNYTNIKAVFHNNDKIFQFYPLIKKEQFEDRRTELIYMSNCKLRKPEITSEFIDTYKDILNKNLILLDDYSFWNNEKFNNINNKKKYYIYRDLKLHQRVDIVNDIKIMFPKYFRLFGDDWSSYFKDFNKTIFSKKKIKNLYNGNICLDLGSSSGSISLYPRSIEIIENGGYLLQLKQLDSKPIFQEYENYFTFQSKNELADKIQTLVNDKTLLNNRIKLLQDIFKDSNSLIEKQLNKIFN